MSDIKQKIREFVMASQSEDTAKTSAIVDEIIQDKLKARYDEKRAAIEEG